MKNFLLKTKKFILEFSKKKLIINLIIFSITFIIAFCFDWLLKHNIFPDESFKEHPTQDFWNQEGNSYNWGFIGFRPLLHRGVTSGLNKYIGFTAIHIFSVLIIIILLPCIVFSKKYPYVLFLTILLVGDMGNMIDRFMYQNGVRDILFIPYNDNGTFNGADVLIYIGSIGTCLTIFYYQFLWPWINKKRKARKKLEEHHLQENENLVNRENK